MGQADREAYAFPRLELHAFLCKPPPQRPFRSMQINIQIGLGDTSPPLIHHPDGNNLVQPS